MNHEFDSQTIYSEKFLKNKLKSSIDETADFYDKNMSKVGSTCICPAVILTYFVLKKDENSYLQVFLKECKYIEK